MAVKVTARCRHCGHGIAERPENARLEVVDDDSCILLDCLTCGQIHWQALPREMVITLENAGVRWVSADNITETEITCFRLSLDNAALVWSEMARPYDQETE